MLPLWYPKNVQKRLLLYVLQQLSFFSGIDIPNLEEISLNNIVLRDVTVDPDKLGRVPGCHLRHGRIGTVELAPSTTGSLITGGGINILANDVDIVLSPKMDLDENINDSLMHTLAQSTASLANLLLDGDVAASDATSNGNLNTDTSSSDNQSPLGSPDSSDQKPSALGSVMQRVVELAVAKILITIRNLNIKLITDSLDVCIIAEEIKVKTVDGKRLIKITALRIVTPQIVRHSGTVSPPAGQKANAPSPKWSMAEEASIYMSALSHEPGAVSQAPMQNAFHTLVFMDFIDFKYEGTSSISKLDIKIGTIVVSAPSLLSALGLVMDSFSRNLKRGEKHRPLRLKETRSRNAANYASREEKADLNDSDSPRTDVTQESSESNACDSDKILDSLSIRNVIICVDSEITNLGDIKKPEATRVLLKQINYVRKDATLAFGGVRQIKAVGYGKNGERQTWFSFEENLTSTNLGTPTGLEADIDLKADLRFEWHTASSPNIADEVSVLLSKPATMCLDLNSITVWTLLGNFLEHALRSYSALSLNLSRLSKPRSTLKFETGVPHAKPMSSLSTNLTIQTSLATLNLEISDDWKLQFAISPIHYDFGKTHLKISDISLNLFERGTLRPNVFLKISKIVVQTKKKSFKSKIDSGVGLLAHAYATSSLSARLTCWIKSATLGTDREIIEKLLPCVSHFLTARNEAVAELAEQYEDCIPGSHAKSKTGRQRVARLAPYSIPRGSRVEAAILIKIEEIVASLTSPYPGFEEFKFLLNAIDCYTIDTQVYGSIARTVINAFSEKSNINGKLVEQLKCGEMCGASMVSLSYDYSMQDMEVRVLLHHALFEYYTEWLKAFDAVYLERSGRGPASLGLPKSQPNVTLKFILKDCVVGLNPGSLSSKANLLIASGSLDIKLENRLMNASFQLNELEIALTDCTDNHPEEHNKSRILDSQAQWGNAEYFRHLGYVVVAIFNSILGDFAKYDSDARAKASVALGDCDIRLCSDSMHTLVQLVGDLTLPFNLKPSEKYRLNTEHPINILKDVDSSFFLSDEKLNVDDRSQSNMPHTNSEMACTAIDVELSAKTTRVYLYDGFDWKETRKCVRGAMRNLERAKRDSETCHTLQSQEATGTSGGEESVQAGDSDENNRFASNLIKETLFRSFHLAMHPSSDPVHVAALINETLQGHAQETTSREKAQSNIKMGKNYKNLLLHRAKSHNFVADFRHVKLRLLLYDTSTSHGALVSSICVNVQDIKMYDNVPTSTWNMFLGYMDIMGERELDSNIVEFRIDSLRPEPNLLYTENVVEVKILPLRAYLDQDTLGFLSRFFEFRDDRFKLAPQEIPYFQKVTLSSLKIKLDYKPKRIDYMGIRSGRTSELANFFVLNGADINLPSVKRYGMMGLSEVGAALVDAWAPTFRQKQIIAVLAGMAPLRPFVNIGEGFRDLVSAPAHEYARSNGHVVRGFRKGTTQFAKTAGYELLMMGAKVTSGTQSLLEQGEAYLGGQGSKAPSNSGGKVVIQSESRLEWGVSEDGGERRKFWKATGLDSHPPIDIGQYDIDESRNNQELLTRSAYVLNSAVADAEQSGDSFLRDLSESLILDVADLPENGKKISLYANQPESVKSGLQMAYNSMGKTVKMTSKTFEKIRKDVAETDSIPDKMAKIAKLSPVILIRPLIGATEAISKTLMGLGNSIDRERMRDLRQKYVTLEADSEGDTESL